MNEDQKNETVKKERRKKTVAEIKESIQASRAKLKKELAKLAKKEKEIDMTININPIISILKNNMSFFTPDNYKKIKEFIEKELAEAKAKNK